MTNFNELSPAEAERLALLLEELGEAQQAIGKILRHGYENHHPEFPETTNRENLENEIGDVLAAMNIMCRKGDINRGDISRCMTLKESSVLKWLHHQGP